MYLTPRGRRRYLVRFGTAAPDPSPVSLPRRVAGTATGALLGCGFTITLLVLGADAASEADGSSAAWALGLVVLYMGAIPALLLGAIGGGWVGRRYLARRRLAPWHDKPRGIVLGHYPVSWLGGVSAAIASSVIVLPGPAFLIQITSMYIGMLRPTAMAGVTLLVLLVALLGMVSIGRSTLHALDRAIHKRRLRTVWRVRSDAAHIAHVTGRKR